MTDADTPSTDGQRFFLKSWPEYNHIVSQFIKHQRKPHQMKPDKDCLFTAVLQKVYYWANYVTPDMLHKQMALYMIKRPHIFYPHISKQLMKDKESYESFVTNIFNSRRWDEWISLTVICHMWNIPIGLVTPYHPSVINMFHAKEQCVVIIIANGWAADGMDITHYAASVRIDEDEKQIPYVNQKGEELILKNYRNLNKTRSNALEFSVQQQTMTTIMAEDQCALEGLLNLQTQEVENQQYAQQQTLEYPEMGNVTQPQLQQMVTYPQVPKVNYPHPTSTVTSEGGHKIIPIHSKMSDEDIIRLLLTESGLVRLSRNSMLFTETVSTVTAEEE